MPRGAHLTSSGTPAARRRTTLALLGGLLLATGCARDDRVRVAPPDPDATGRAACGRLLDELPETVADQPRRPVVPADALAAAWGDPAIVLRCGVTRPTGFDRGSSCVTVDDVDWFIPEEQLEEPGDLTMTTVKREQHVEVVVPEEHWPPGTALADLSDVVSGAIQRQGQCV